MENTEILRKADMVLSDLSAGGSLNPEQANKFIDMVQAAPTLLKSARVERMKARKQEVPKLGFANRIMRRAVENTALAEADRSKPSMGKMELDTVELIAEVRLPYAALEDNVEGQSYEDHIMRLIAERAALDIEEVVVQGDTGSLDEYLASFDGVMKLAGHTVDAQGALIDKALWKKLVAAVPAKYFRNRKEWRLYTSPNNELNWREKLSDRATGAGDRFLLEDVPAVAFGIPVEPLAMIPEVASGTPEVTQTSALLTHPQNIVVGFHRDISVESDKVITSRQYIIVVTCRVGVALEEADATAKMTNIKVS